VLKNTPKHLQRSLSIDVGQVLALFVGTVDALDIVVTVKQWVVSVYDCDVVVDFSHLNCTIPPLQPLPIDYQPSVHAIVVASASSYR
jgi:hypothetical protein